MPSLRTLSAIGIVVSSFVVSSAGAAPVSAHQRALRLASSRVIPLGHHLFITRLDWARVVKVHMCEQSNWHARGSVYSGGLGWMNGLWPQYRASWMPASMADAAPLEQAWAMVRFVNGALHYWPHQTYPAYCGAGY